MILAHGAKTELAVERQQLVILLGVRRRDEVVPAGRGVLNRLPLECGGDTPLPPVAVDSRRACPEPARIIRRPEIRRADEPIRISPDQPRS